MICDACSHRKACEKELSDDGRCMFFIKDGHVGIDDDIDINPMDTFVYDYDDLQMLIQKQRSPAKN